MLSTHREVVEKLGGTGTVAKLLCVVPSAVSNAMERNAFPYRWHTLLLEEAQKRGLRIAPEVFGLTPERAHAMRQGLG